MPLYKEELFLVVHPGLQYTLFSLGVRDSLSLPQFRIPSVVFHNDDGLWAATRESSGEAVYPIVAQHIVNVDAFTYLLKVILLSLLAANPLLTIAQVPLLIVAPGHMWLRTLLEQVTRYVFENLEFSAFNAIDAAVASTFAVGASATSVVVNLGHEYALVTPVVGSRAISLATEHMPNLGGKALLSKIQDLLPCMKSEHIEALKCLGIFQVLGHKLGGFYLMDDLALGSLRIDVEAEDDDEFNVARLVAESGDSASAIQAVVDDAAANSKPNHELETNSFISSDGERLLVGKERFQGTDDLVDAWARAVYASLCRIPSLDRRQECFDNIICVGGTFRVPGLKESLLARILAFYVAGHALTAAATNIGGANALAARAIAAYQLTDDPLAADTVTTTGQVPHTVRLAKFPEYFSEWKKPKLRGGLWDEAYFLGAEIYAKQIFTANHNRDMFVDTELYKERGPAFIWTTAM